MVDTKEVVVLLHCRPKLEDILQQTDNGKFTGFFWTKPMNIARSQILDRARKTLMGW